MKEEKNIDGIRSPSSGLLLWAILIACFGYGLFLLSAPWTVTTLEEEKKARDQAKKMEEEAIKQYPGMKRILDESTSSK